MIKKLFIAAAAAMMASAGAFAQEAPAPESGEATVSKAEKFYQTVPKHEFFIEGFAGFGPLLYKTHGPAEAAVSSTVWPWKAGDFMSLQYPVGTGYGGGLGYIWHFHPNVGLLVGAEFAVYNGGISWKAGDNGNPHVMMSENVKTSGEEATMILRVDEYWEVQKLMTVQIPVMFQFMAPMGRGNNHFYAAVGAKLGINVLGKYQGGIGTVYDQDWGGNIATFRRGWDGYVESGALNKGKVYPFESVDANDYDSNDAKRLIGEGDKTEHSGKYDFNRINAIVSAELGFRWKLSSAVGLYTGLYVDYGCLGINKLGNKAIYGFPYPFDEPDLQYHSPSEFHASIMNAPAAPDALIREKDGVNIVDLQKPKAAAGNVHPIGFGLKMKLAFGKVMPTPPPPPPVLPKPDTVVKTIVIRDTVSNTVVVRDTVTNTVVVRDTITIIKEIPVEIQKTMRDLSNTLFEFNKFNLGEKARGYLDEIVDWLVANPKVNVEIGGHTDGIGSQEYNQKLSEQRAKTVYNYFVEHGVNKDRLSYKGYGKSEPIADNSTDAGRQQNRRVELKIIND